MGRSKRRAERAALRAPVVFVAPPAPTVPQAVIDVLRATTEERAQRKAQADALLAAAADQVTRNNETESEDV